MTAKNLRTAIPISVLEHYIQALESDANSIARRLGDALAEPTRMHAMQLRVLVQDPAHRWISTAEAAARKGCSEETIRRHCRNGSAAFEFEKSEGGTYSIWLPDIIERESK